MPKDIIKQLSKIVGAKYVLSGDDDRANFDTDVTGKYKGRSLAVVSPASTAEVSEIVRLAGDASIAIIPQSGNTGLNGGTFPGSDSDQIILSLARMNTIRNINPEGRTATVEAGVILENLHSAVDEHDLIFPLMFGARGSCMIGGNLSTNAGGSNVVRYGNTRDLCLGLEVVMPNGQIVDLMSELRKNNTGYDLKDLFIGAEGTLGVITAAVLKLSPKPKAYATAMVSVPDIPTALKLLHKIQSASGGSVEAYEYMPRSFFEHLNDAHPDLRPPFETPAEVGILVELGATAPKDATPRSDGSLPVTSLLEDILSEGFESGEVLDAIIAQSQEQRAEMWHRRELAYEAVVHRGPSVDTDVAVPLDKVDAFVSAVGQRLNERFPGAESATIAHLGDGNLHYSVWLRPGSGDAHTSEEKDAVFTMIEDVVQDLRGSFSAEHGIGLSKKSTMARRKDPAALAVMRQIKAALDPKGIMNPGKVLPE